MSSLGKHHIIEYWGSTFEVLDDEKKLREMFEQGLWVSGASVIQIVFHKFSPQGVTGVAAIAESHVSIHTWPEHGYAAVDVFSCSDKMSVPKLLSHFESILKPTDKSIKLLERGEHPQQHKFKKPSA